MATKAKTPKSEKVTVTVQVQVPAGTSKTKVEKELSTLLKSGNPEGFKIGAPKAQKETATPQA